MWKMKPKKITTAIACLDKAELKNILEQERFVEDASKVFKMLSFSLSDTMRRLAEKHKLPKEFELDRTTGEIFPKGDK